MKSPHYPRVTLVGAISPFLLKEVVPRATWLVFPSFILSEATGLNISSPLLLRKLIPWRQLTRRNYYLFILLKKKEFEEIIKP